MYRPCSKLHANDKKVLSISFASFIFIRPTKKYSPQQFDSMIEFSKQIADKWNIPADIAEKVCSAFEKGDSPYYLSEYKVEFGAELSNCTIWEICDFLTMLQELGSKKKRVLNAYKKAELLTPDLEKQINFTISPFELDDLLIPLRPNARSKGQVAQKKGIGPLADLILLQKEEVEPVEVLAEAYIEKDPSFKSADDVIAGVKDIIAERVAYDETVRAMAREFAFDDCFFEVVPKNKKDQKFVQYLDRYVPISELSHEEILQLCIAEDDKKIRFKMGVQLFRINELLRHHFITNPDATGFDLICETIDECWLRLLQPIIERDVKSRLRETAEAWATRHIVQDLEKLYSAELVRGPLLMVDASPDKQVLFITISGTGELLGTTTERKLPDGKIGVSERLRQFIGRYRAEKIAIVENSFAETAESFLAVLFQDADVKPEVVRYQRHSSTAALAKSEWVQREFANLLDVNMIALYCDALHAIKPVSMLTRIGINSFSVHSFQALIPSERFLELVSRLKMRAQLTAGIALKDCTDSAITALSCVSEKLLQAIKAADSEGLVTIKNDLLNVPGMNEVAFRNCAGFLVVQGSESILDRTAVHPDQFSWFEEMGAQLNVSLDTMVTEPEILRSYVTNDVLKKIFIETKLIPQIDAGRRFVMQPSNKARRKLKLTEVIENAIVSGRVTNITQFGVFVNINAVCDGLIHISQLADEYVETPDQVVAVNDRIDVRILKVDVKKRRISLSMRNLGHMAPKVHASKGQLSTLADYFKNR